ncbi:MAG: hypothetical protein NVSMB19_23350 [Vulcanimicrobiaceae bacterium]
MDELVAFFGDRIARQIRNARAAAAEQQRIAAEIAGPLPPERAPAGPRTRPPVPAQAGPPAPAPRRLRAVPESVFPTSVERFAPPTPPPAASPLLAAFAGGSTLLGALVLAEALAPPVALREGPPHRR